MAQTTSDEKLRLTTSAMSVMEKWDRPIILGLDIVMAIGIIGQLQLAFRHPENTHATRQMVEKYVRGLIDQLDPKRGDFHAFLLMGFDESNDE